MSNNNSKAMRSLSDLNAYITDLEMKNEALMIAISNKPMQPALYQCSGSELGKRIEEGIELYELNTELKHKLKISYSAENQLRLKIDELNSKISQLTSDYENQSKLNRQLKQDNQRIERQSYDIHLKNVSANKVISEQLIRITDLIKQVETLKNKEYDTYVEHMKEIGILRNKIEQNATPITIKRSTDNDDEYFIFLHNEYIANFFFCRLSHTAKLLVKDYYNN